MQQSFEQVMALHCAPVLLGKKPAALISSKALPHGCPWAQLRGQGLSVVRLRWRGNEPLVFLYRAELLRESLSHEQVRGTLAELGYPVEKDFRSLLGHLFRRFRDCEAFPHEVGFFLGYPPEDVLGFMNSEAEYKLCGAWKVYGDVSRAEATFREYENCRKKLLEHIGNGGSILGGNLSALAG